MQKVHSFFIKYPKLRISFCLKVYLLEPATPLFYLQKSEQYLIQTAIKSISCFYLELS